MSGIHFSSSWKLGVKAKVLAGLVASEASLLGPSWEMAILSLCPHVGVLRPSRSPLLDEGLRTHWIREHPNYLV